MITIHCSSACAHLASPPELLTAGMSKAVTVQFVFSPEWDGLTKTAVFSNGKTTVDVLAANWDGDTVTVPHEVLAVPGRHARVGVYGADESGVVLPTVWVSLGKVQPAADPSGDPSTDHTLPVWAQLQEIIGDLADLTTKAKNNLVAAINEAAKTGSGGAGSIDLRTADGYIQYSNDGGATWENLIALADLKGEKGEKGETGATGPAGQDGVPGKDGSSGKDGADGAPGQDGFSPSASVTQTGTGATITITDKTGTTTAEIKNGKDGAPGKDGTNGKDGAPGATGPQGPAGKTPVKGTDYFTEADKQEIAEDAAALVDLSGKQNKITAAGILKGDGAGGVSAAKAGTDYATPAQVAAKQDVLLASGASVGDLIKVKAVDASGKPTAWAVAVAGTDYMKTGNITKQTLVSAETTPTENYAINWQYE